MKKLKLTKEQFNKSRYFKTKYGKLKYVSENGKYYRTTKGKVIQFNEFTQGAWDVAMGKMIYDALHIAIGLGLTALVTGGAIGVYWFKEWSMKRKAEKFIKFFDSVLDKMIEENGEEAVEELRKMVSKNSSGMYNSRFSVIDFFRKQLEKMAADSDKKVSRVATQMSEMLQGEFYHKMSWETAKHVEDAIADWDEANGTEPEVVDESNDGLAQILAMLIRQAPAAQREKIINMLEKQVSGEDAGKDAGQRVRDSHIPSGTRVSKDVADIDYET